NFTTHLIIFRFQTWTHLVFLLLFTTSIIIPSHSSVKNTSSNIKNSNLKLQRYSNKKPLKDCTTWSRTPEKLGGCLWMMLLQLILFQKAWEFTSRKSSL